MTPIILSGGIDLSIGSLLGLCAVIFGKLWRDAHLPVFAAALCTLAGCGRHQAAKDLADQVDKALDRTPQYVDRPAQEPRDAQ